MFYLKRSALWEYFVLQHIVLLFLENVTLLYLFEMEPLRLNSYFKKLVVGSENFRISFLLLNMERNHDNEFDLVNSLRIWF